MNTTFAPQASTRLASVAFALALTLAMLLGVNGLAKHEGGAPLMAHASANAQA